MRLLACIASTRAISYFAFRCYSEIVANRPAWNWWPVRCFQPHLSRFFSIPPIPLSFLASLCSLSASSRQPLLTRRDVLLMKMKGLLIFSFPREESARLSCPSFFFLSIVDLSFFRHHCFHFPRPTFSPKASFSSRVSFFLFSLSLSSVTCTIARGGNITFHIYRTGLPRGNATTSSAREINSDWYHALR